jgi:hypothetical protein
MLCGSYQHEPHTLVAVFFFGLFGMGRIVRRKSVIGSRKSGGAVSGVGLS